MAVEPTFPEPIIYQRVSQICRGGKGLVSWEALHTQQDSASAWELHEDSGPSG